MTLYHDVAGKQTQTTIPLCGPVKNGVFYQKVRSFLDAVRDGGKAPVSTSEIFSNQIIIDSIVKSAKLGNEIDIEIPEI